MYKSLPPPPLFLDQTCTEVLLLLVKSWKLDRYIVLLLKKPSGLPWSFKPQYQYAYSFHCFDTSTGENLFKDKGTSLWWSFPSFSWPVCLIRQCYYWEKLDAGHFWPGALIVKWKIRLLVEIEFLFLPFHGVTYM